MLENIRAKLKSMKKDLDRPEYQVMVKDFRKGILRGRIPCSRERALEFAVLAGNIPFFHSLYDETYKDFDLDKIISLLCLAIVQFPDSNKLSFSIFERIKKVKAFQLLALESKVYFKIAFVTNNIHFFRYILDEISKASDDKGILKNVFYKTISADDICSNIENGYFEIVDAYLSAQSFEVVIQILTYKGCKILNAYYQKGDLEKVRNLISHYSLESKFPSRLLALYININDYESFENLANKLDNKLSELIRSDDYSVIKRAFRCNDSRFTKRVMHCFSDTKHFQAMQIRFAQEENSKNGRLEIFEFLWGKEPIDFPMMQLCKSSYFKNALLTNNTQIARFIWENHDQDKLAKEVGNYNFIAECLAINSMRAIEFILTGVITSEEKKREIVRQHNYKLFVDICSPGWLSIARIMAEIEAEEKYSEMVLAFSGSSLTVALKNNHYDLLEFLMGKLPVKGRFDIIKSKVRNIFDNLIFQNGNLNSFLVLACALEEDEIGDLSEHILKQELSANGSDISNEFQRQVYSEFEIKTNRRRLLDLRNRGFSFSQIFEMQKYKDPALPLILVSKQMLSSLPSEINYLIGYYLSGASVAYSIDKYGFVIKSMQLEIISQLPHLSQANSILRSEFEKNKIDQLRLLQASLN